MNQINLRADDVRVAYPLFQAERSGSRPTSALQLHFGEIDWRIYQRLVTEWHSSMPNIPDKQAWGHKACYGAMFDGLYYAVAGWARPVSRMLPQDSCLELRRMAIASDAPKNTASRMLGWMVRDIRRRMTRISHCISYQDTDVHIGTIYRAAGWEAELTGNGGDWSCRSRPRAKGNASVKIRWGKSIVRNRKEGLEPVGKPA